ncbi:hypothetical protein [Aliifodinibius salipaludis]|uniref:hypothetical protein n=1 Tax=Fodinibius salipaludis TaxID=2032627 RepID=UPI00159542F3|nr:hypothetical protein [Aliifodinibius salipaludis]
MARLFPTPIREDETITKGSSMTLLFWITLVTFGLVIFWGLFKSIDFFADI